MASFEYDEIGYWSEVKLDIIKKYATAYSAIIHPNHRFRKHLYIDAFAGSGLHVSRRTHKFVPGSPLNALEIKPAFTEYHLIDLDRDKVASLRRKVGARPDVFLYNEDANTVLMDKIFPRCLYEDFNRGLCVLDPYGLSVDWSVVQRAGEMKSIEIFYNLMIMDANRNVLWRNPERVSPDQAERMDKVWGSHSWREEAYLKRTNLWGEESDAKATNDHLATAFRQHLINDAGFGFVPKPLPMRNAQGATIYYLFFASPNKTGARIVQEIFDTYKTRGIV